MDDRTKAVVAQLRDLADRIEAGMTVMGVNISSYLGEPQLIDLCESLSSTMIQINLEFIPNRYTDRKTHSGPTPRSGAEGVVA